MRFKPNYRIERAERDRAKKARKGEKLRRQQDRATQRIDDSAQQPAASPETHERVPIATSGLRGSGSEA